MMNQKHLKSLSQWFQIFKSNDCFNTNIVIFFKYKYGENMFFFFKGVRN